MKIAVAQTECVLGDLSANIEKHLDFCSKAIKAKAELIVFPELSLTGYSLKDINTDIAVNPYRSKSFAKLEEMSRKISIVCGFAEEGDDYAIYNSAGFFSEGKLRFTHRKIYPPTYGLFEELRYFSHGKTCMAHNTKHGKISLLVCEDLWHPALPYLSAIDGAEVIIGIAASPTKMAPESSDFANYEVNTQQHRSFARLLSVYLVFSNRVGFEDGVNFWGGSEVIDPFGNPLAVAKLFDEDIIFADIEQDEIRRARQNARHFLSHIPELTLDNLRRILERKHSEQSQTLMPD